MNFYKGVGNRNLLLCPLPIRSLSSPGFIIRPDPEATIWKREAIFFTIPSFSRRSREAIYGNIPVAELLPARTPVSRDERTPCFPGRAPTERPHPPSDDFCTSGNPPSEPLIRPPVLHNPPGGTYQTGGRRIRVRACMGLRPGISGNRSPQRGRIGSGLIWKKGVWGGGVVGSEGGGWG